MDKYQAQKDKLVKILDKEDPEELKAALQEFFPNVTEHDMDTSPNDPINDTQDQIEKKSDNGESGNASPPRGKEGVPKKSSMEAQIEEEIAEKCMVMEKEIVDKYPQQSKDIANVSPVVSKRQEKEKSTHNGNDKLKENTDSCSKDKLRKEKEDVFAIKGPGGKNLLVTKIPIPTSDSAKQTVNPIQKS